MWLLKGTDVSEECIASIIRVTIISKLGMLPVTSKQTANVPNSPILDTLKMEATCSSATSVLTRATWLKNQKTTFFSYIEFRM
jgi:hypothetical protein